MTAIESGFRCLPLEKLSNLLRQVDAGAVVDRGPESVLATGYG